MWIIEGSNICTADVLSGKHENLIKMKLCNLMWKSHIPLLSDGNENPYPTIHLTVIIYENLFKEIMEYCVKVKNSFEAKVLFLLTYLTTFRACSYPPFLDVSEKITRRFLLLTLTFYTVKIKSWYPIQFVDSKSK